MDYTIADRLAELRRAQGLSQEALAAELGLTRQAVSRWERGESLPDTENLIALADLYGVKLDELVRPQVAVQEETSVEDDATCEEAIPEEATPLAQDASLEGEAPAAVALLEDDASREGELADGSEPDGAAPVTAASQEETAMAVGDSLPSAEGEPAAVTGRVAGTGPAAEEAAPAGAPALPASQEPPVTPEVPASSAAHPSPMPYDSYQRPHDVRDAPRPDCVPAPTDDAVPQQESLAFRAGGCLAKVLVGCLIVGVLGAALTVGGCVLFQWHTGSEVVEEHEYPADGVTVQSSDASTNETFVDAGQVESLNIDWAAGQVKVMVDDDEEIGPGVLVSEDYLSDSEQDCPMQVKVEHGTLEISYGREGQWRTNVGKGKRLTVRIAATLARQLQGVSCELAGGSLELGDLTCQTLDLELAGGTMDVRDVVARDLDVKVAAGEANVRGSFAGAVDMDLSAGSVRVSSGVVPTTTDIDVSLGKATFELPTDASFKANVDKAGGTFKLDFAATQKGDTYTVAHGGSAVNVDIAGGSVHIRER